ncbi:triose-phosphate transporter family-domain-containing protein [Hyaloraphidium curvatum]|nr:triose-phosphate transporter family-domain-containing protein [Hyaloraphidium curvatum]
MASAEMIGWLAGNVAATVGIVMFNKQVVRLGFMAMVFLSALHMIATYIGCVVMLRLKVFEYKDAAFRTVFIMAMASLASVVFMNLNLAYNSVGFYQLSKLGTIPITVTLEYIFFRKTISWRVAATLLLISAGVGIATVTDISFNVTGTIYAAIAMVCTSASQVFFDPLRKEIECDALQALYHTTPVIAAGMLLCSPAFGELEGIRQTDFHVGLVVAIALSCVTAIAVNVTNYAVLSRISALSYTILGHFKTISILTLGAILFDSKPGWKSIAGAVLALGGVVLYSELKRRGL